MSVLGEEVSSYIVSRRRFGFVVRHDEGTLRSFVRFCDNAGITTVTSTSIVEWATAPVGVTGAWSAQRFGVARRFAQHLHLTDPGHEVPPQRLIVGHYERVTPYLYTGDEIDAVMTAAGRLSGRIRPIAYRTLIGLLAATGMRISEALGLDDTNVEFDAGLITVRNAKFNKSRQLPLHSTTIAALGLYVSSRRDIRADDVAGDGQAFFVSDTGRRIGYGQCREMFSRCLDQAGVTAPAGRRRPRIHDLRHTFAVNTLIDWYSNGVNVNAYLPYLSTYLGHVEPAATYWYFSGSPELAGVIASRLDSIKETVNP